MKHLFYLIFMILPVMGFSQKVVPDDSTNHNLVYVTDWYEGKGKVLVYQYVDVKQDNGLYQKELTATKSKVKKLVTTEGVYFKSMTIKLANKKCYTIGYHNYLAIVNRLGVKDLKDALESGSLNLILKNNELSLMYKEKKGA